MIDPSGDRTGPTFTERVRTAVADLGQGEIATYGEIASDAGRPGAARAVGRILSGSNGLPWWRVVTATGRLVPGMEEEHALRLEREGVPVRGNRVVGSPQGGRK